MTHKIYIAERILRYLYEVTVAGMILYAFCMIFMRQEPSVTYFFWIAGALLLSYLIREFAPNHVLLAGGHILLVGILIVLPGAVWIRAVTGLFDLGYLLPCAIAYAKRGSRLLNMSEPWPPILAGVLIYFASLGLHLDVLANVSYAGVALLLAIYVLIRYVQGLKRYMTQSTEVSERSIRNIAIVNGRTVLILSGIMLLLMGACRFLDLSGLVNVLAAFCVKGIQTLFGAIMVIWVFVLTLLTRGGAAATSLDYQDTLNEYYQNSVKGYDVFTVILRIFLVCLLIILLLRLVWRIMGFLLKPRTYAGDVIETVAGEEKKEQKEKTISPGFMRKLTDEERARNLYKREVLRYKNEIVLDKRSTCEDIRREIMEQTTGNVDELSAVYEEIRYGTTETDGAVLRRIKTIIKKQSKKRS